MDPAQGGFSTPARGLIILGSLSLVILLASTAASILAPLLLAAFIAIISAPALLWMKAKGVPKWAALAVILFVLVDLGSLLALVTTGALEGFRESLPSYQERFVLLSERFGGWMESVGVAGSREALPDLLNPNQVVLGVRILLSNASGIFATGLLVLLAVAFMLMEASAIPAKLRAAFDLDEEGDRRLGRLLASIRRYMLIKTLTSAATALCIWLWLFFLGIEFAVLWAVMAFFLNFIPVVGNIVMMIPATLVALIQTDLATTWLVVAGYLFINTLIGSVLEPRIMGRGLGLSTLAVFIGLLFWGWLFGTIGMFLAVPLTVTLLIALDASPHTRALAILLGPSLKEEPDTLLAQAMADVEALADARATPGPESPSA